MIKELSTCHWKMSLSSNSSNVAWQTILWMASPWQAILERSTKEFAEFVRSQGESVWWNVRAFLISDNRSLLQLKFLPSINLLFSVFKMLPFKQWLQNILSNACYARLQTFENVIKICFQKRLQFHENLTCICFQFKSFLTFCRCKYQISFVFS